MNTKNTRKLLALLTVFVLLFTACGAREDAPAETEASLAAETAASAELGLTDWTLTASMWSSANGASIDLTATPTAYTEGMTASFVVRLEGEEIVNNPCQWNGTSFTSYADLNAEDGYCYYVELTDAAHTVAVDVNTPHVPFDESLINLSASLESFCSLTVSNAAYEDGKLTLTQGTALIQAPLITADGEAVTCTAAELVLNLDGGALSKESLNDKLSVSSSKAGSRAADLAGVSFSVPEMEGDHQLTLMLVAYLSDGTTLTDGDNTSWFYSDGNIQLTVG